MNKEQFEEKFVGEKIAVHVKTEKLALAFIKLAYSFGYRWKIGSSNNVFWEGDEKCYHLLKESFGFENIITHSTAKITIGSEKDKIVEFGM